MRKRDRRAQDVNGADRLAVEAAPSACRAMPAQLRQSQLQRVPRSQSRAVDPPTVVGVRRPTNSRRVGWSANEGFEYLRRPPTRRTSTSRSHRRAGRQLRGEGRTVPRGEAAREGPTGAQAGCGAENRLTEIPPARRPEAPKNKLTSTGMQAGGAREASSQDPPGGVVGGVS